MEYSRIGIDYKQKNSQKLQKTLLENRDKIIGCERKWEIRDRFQ